MEKIGAEKSVRGTEAGMDIPRVQNLKARRLRRILYAAGGVAVVLLITLGLSQLEPAAPTVEGGGLYMDTVKRGSMLRQMRGIGTLVPEEIQWIPAETQARVDRILILPGALVTPETVVLEMSNPDLELSVVDAEWQVKAAEAAYASTKARLETDLLNQKAAAADIEAQYRQARLQAQTDSALAREGSGSELNAKLAKLRAEGLEKRYEIEQQRVAINAQSIEAQLSEQRARVEQLRALYAMKKRQVESLRVRAGIEGVLQDVPVEVGQWVTPGTNVARVSDPKRLKAEIRVAETQAKDLLIGQKAAIDTRLGVVPGRVIRVAPSSQNGTVAVDVALEGDLPPGARPDLSVEGIVEIERLENVLYMGRPAYGQGQSTIGLFKLEEDGKTAVRVQVRLGRNSVTTIEVLDGLKENDRVILSDMSAWDAVDRIRLR
jgi:HlyD family secretion protein